MATCTSTWKTRGLLVCLFNSLRLKSIKITQRHQYYYSTLYSSRDSQNTSKATMDLQAAVTKLEKLFPIDLAESWDNVGLLVEPSSPYAINNVMLTNDVTEVVLQEAIDRKVNLIISYHPPIFYPFKQMWQSVLKQRIVIKCIENRIALYSPHTSSDNVLGGVNDWLLDGLGAVNWKRPICIKDNTNSGVNTDGAGSGRICELQRQQPLSEIVHKIKTHLGISHVRLALPSDKQSSDIKDISVGIVCVCAGSGGSILRIVEGYDNEPVLLWSGEMSHHDILHATGHGRIVVLCEHSNTERPYIHKHLVTLLRQNVFTSPDINIMLAETDKEPLQVV